MSDEQTKPEDTQEENDAEEQVVPGVDNTDNVIDDSETDDSRPDGEGSDKV